MVKRTSKTGRNTRKNNLIHIELGFHTGIHIVENSDLPSENIEECEIIATNQEIQCVNCDTITHISCFLELRDIINLMLSCRFFYNILTSDHCFREIISCSIYRDIYRGLPLDDTKSIYRSIISHLNSQIPRPGRTKPFKAKTIAYYQTKDVNYCSDDDENPTAGCFEYDFHIQDESDDDEDPYEKREYLDDCEYLMYR